MSDFKRPLPKELEPLREWIEARRPYPEQSLEESLAADTSVYVNPSRAVVENGFQEAIAMLATAVREGRVKIVRARKPRAAESPVGYDPPARWPSAIELLVRNGA